MDKNEFIYEDKDTEFSISFVDYFRKFIKEELNKIPSKNIERDIHIFYKRYGLEGDKIYTLDDIGSYYGISRQRIDQIIDRTLEILKSIIDGKSDTIKLPNKFILKVHEFRSNLCSTGIVITWDEVINIYKEKFHSAIKQEDSPFIKLLMELYEFEPLPVNNFHPNVHSLPGWFTDNSINKQEYKKIQTEIDKLLLAYVKPLNIFDIVVRINKNRKVKLSPEFIESCIKTMPQIEKLAKDSYQIKFYYLQSLANKAYRILYEKESKMTVEEISYEMNHRLSFSNDDQAVSSNSIRNQLTTDKRFKSIGKSGWKLSEWQDISTKTIVGLINDFFYQNNRDGKVEEIYDYVKTKRPTTKYNSVQSYLFQKDKFTRVSKDTFAPALWKMKEHVSNFSPPKRNENTIRANIEQDVLEYMKLQNTEWIELSKIKSYVMKKSNCKSHTFYSYLNNMSQIEKEKQGGKVYCKLLDIKVNPFLQEAKVGWEQLIKNGENREVEFKRAAKWNDFENKKDNKMIDEIIITISGFLNSSVGGRLFIGVDDRTGKILGIENDYKAADKNKPNQDGYKLFLSNSISDKLGKNIEEYYDIEIENIERKDICCIRVKPCPFPVFYDNDFYLRANVGTKKLSSREATKYISETKKIDTIL